MRRVRPAADLGSDLVSIRFAVIGVVCACFAFSAHGQPEVASNEEVRTLSMRVGERAQGAFYSTWSEYRSLVDLGGKDDGTTLTGYMMSACREHRGHFWMNTSVWLTNHVSESKGPRTASRITGRFRKRLKEAFRSFDDMASTLTKKSTQEQEGAPDSTGGYHVLRGNESILKEAKSHEMDLRQRAEILLVLRELVSVAAQQHESAPKALEYGLGFALLRRTQCEFGDAGADYLDAILSTERSEVLDAKTQLALLIIFINVNDMERKRALLEDIEAKASSLSDDPAFVAVFQRSFHENLEDTGE